jgi:hypothetical protein
MMGGKSMLSFDDANSAIGGTIAEVNNPDDIIEAFVAFDKVCFCLERSREDCKY